MGSLPEPSDADFLNSQNQTDDFPSNSDVVVVGGGIHSLIYAIHTRLKGLRNPSLAAIPSITVLEKSQTPGYKIGESTLTVFGLWLKTIGIGPALLWRLFGPKDGLAFYYLPQGGDPEAYTSFAANGPPGDFVPTLQIERKISELLLTLFAQRLGVKVLHGHAVDIDATRLPFENSEELVDVKVTSGQLPRHIQAKFLVDATGRFKRFASKGSRSTRFPGFNTDAFWAYFECPGDEADIPLDHYESCNTNHICLAEGWAWVIRLPSWEGSPIPNLIAMINYLLDLNDKGIAPDAYPSSLELARRFDLKFKWVVSIGFALRNDVVYPDDLPSYGTCEAERKFNWITKRYPKMQALMDRHVLIEDLYGPKTTWFIRKSLTYNCPVVAGHRWAAIGDATCFTNPLYSPGINANMATSVNLAEKTAAYLQAKSGNSRSAVLDEYQLFCSDRIPNLHRMNVFNYLCMRSPRTGPLGPLWQYLCGTGNAKWQKLRSYTFDNASEVLTAWDWGANEEEYIRFAKKVIKVLDGPPTAPDDHVIEAVIALSGKAVREVLEAGKYKNRWAGLLRWYDDDLCFRADKVGRDVLSRRCEGCGNWRILHSGATKCATCGVVCKENNVQLYN